MIMLLEQLPQTTNIKRITRNEKTTELAETKFEGKKRLKNQEITEKTKEKNVKEEIKEKLERSAKVKWKKPVFKREV